MIDLFSGAPSKRHVPSLGVGDPSGIAKVKKPYLTIEQTFPLSIGSY